MPGFRVLELYDELFVVVPKVSTSEGAYENNTLDCNIDVDEAAALVPGAKMNAGPDVRE